MKKYEDKVKAAAISYLGIIFTLLYILFTN